MLNEIRRKKLRHILKDQIEPRDNRGRPHQQGALSGILGFVELNKVMNIAWKDCDEFAKSVFNELAEEGRVIYARKVEAYNAIHEAKSKMDPEAGGSPGVKKLGEGGNSKSKSKSGPIRYSRVAAQLKSKEAIQKTRNRLMAEKAAAAAGSPRYHCLPHPQHVVSSTACPPIHFPNGSSPIHPALKLLDHEQQQQQEHHAMMTELHRQVSGSCSRPLIPSHQQARVPPSVLNLFAAKMADAVSSSSHPYLLPEYNNNNHVQSRRSSALSLASAAAHHHASMANMPVPHSVPSPPIAATKEELLLSRVQQLESELSAARLQDRVRELEWEINERKSCAGMIRGILAVDNGSGTTTTSRGRSPLEASTSAAVHHTPHGYTSEGARRSSYLTSLMEATSQRRLSSGGYPRIHYP